MASQTTDFMHPTSDAGFGLYVHWPFCAAKCPYCDFNSHVRHQPVDQPRFVAAFEAEIAHMATLAPGRTVTSIFFGGGTPSLMAPETISAILNAIARQWSVAGDVEITMEANPQSVEADRFRAYRAAGVNRLSLGVQALNDPDLKMLGRLHGVAEALSAIDLARATFPRLSFDLIYARPGQTMSAWEQELQRAINLAADHLSLYQLTIEPDTAFASLYKAGKLSIPSPDEGALLYESTQAICAAAGLPAYETSNHAVPGAESQHNLLYWRYGEYAGIGPGAHGRLCLSPTERMATSIERHPETWLSLVERQGHGLIAQDMLSSEAQGDEFLLMGLRLVEGIDLARYEDLAGRPVDQRRLQALLDHEMIRHLPPTSTGSNREQRICATPAGALLLDAVVADLAS